MDVKKYAAGKTRGIGGVTKQGPSTILVSCFNGFNPETGEANPTKDIGLQRADIVRLRGDALLELADAQAKVDGFDALLAEIDAL